MFEANQSFFLQKTETEVTSFVCFHFREIGRNEDWDFEKLDS